MARARSIAIRLVLVLLALCAVGAAALAMSFSGERLEVSAGQAMDVPPASPPKDFSISLLETGVIESKAAFAYRGGGFSDERAFAIGAILLDHPQGRILVDAGAGRDAEAHLLRLPAIYRATTQFIPAEPAIDQLSAAAIMPSDLRAILLTHAHWDHASGVEDFPGVPVWLSPREKEFVESGHEAVSLLASFEGTRVETLAMDEGPYLGFARSEDLFDDGSVVVVETPGHTPGSIVVFVTLPSAKRFAFIGDLAWQREGVELPAERPWITRRMADVDPEQVREGLVQVHRLAKSIPEMTIVPAHDSRALDRIARFPSRTR